MLPHPPSNSPNISIRLHVNQHHHQCQILRILRKNCTNLGNSMAKFSLCNQKGTKYLGRWFLYWEEVTRKGRTIGSGPLHMYIVGPICRIRPFPPPPTTPRAMPFARKVGFFNLLPTFIASFISREHILLPFFPLIKQNSRPLPPPIQNIKFKFINTDCCHGRRQFPTHIYSRKQQWRYGNGPKRIWIGWRRRNCATRNGKCHPHPLGAQFDWQLFPSLILVAFWLDWTHLVGTFAPFRTSPQCDCVEQAIGWQFCPFQSKERCQNIQGMFPFYANHNHLFMYFFSARSHTNQFPLA